MKTIWLFAVVGWLLVGACLTKGVHGSDTVEVEQLRDFEVVDKREEY